MTDTADDQHAAQDAVDRLNDLSGIEVPVSTYGRVSNCLSVHAIDGVSHYTVARIREEGYQLDYYDEVNDHMVFEAVDQ